MDENELNNIQFFLGLKDELNRRDISIDEVTRILSGKTFLSMDMNQLHNIESKNIPRVAPAKELNIFQERQKEVQILHEFLTRSSLTVTLSKSDIGKLVIVFFESLNHDKKMITAHELHELFNARLNNPIPIDLKITYAIRSKYRQILSGQKKFGQIKKLNRFPRTTLRNNSSGIKTDNLNKKSIKMQYVSKKINLKKPKKSHRFYQDRQIRKFILDGYRFGYSGKQIVQKVNEKFNKNITLKTVYNIKYKAHLIERAKKNIPKNSIKVSVFKGKATHEIVHS